jgi:hypothetical protein
MICAFYVIVINIQGNALRLRLLHYIKITYMFRPVPAIFRVKKIEYQKQV